MTTRITYYDNTLIFPNIEKLTIDEVEDLIYYENFNLINVGGYLYLVDFIDELAFNCDDWNKKLFLEDLKNGLVNNFKELSKEEYRELIGDLDKYGEKQY